MPVIGEVCNKKYCNMRDIIKQKSFTCLKKANKTLGTKETPDYKIRRF